MAKKKKSSKKRGHNKSSIEKEYYEEIEYTCPVRGKIKEKIKVTKLKSKLVDARQTIGGGDELDSYGSADDDDNSEESED